MKVPLPREVTGFAEGLGKLKAKHELGQGAELTADEVAGIIWAIKQLRGAAHDAANAAQR